MTVQNGRCQTGLDEIKKQKLEYLIGEQQDPTNGLLTCFSA
ncbi:MAG: hypothetical protein P4M14_12530 [Gammaproteobacteria bacterium]|nr:hypothetical protein [Gammaproteobacteria bacterium]